MIHADKAQEMVRLMQKRKDRDLYITALIEDGMFEEKIMYPAALCAEFCWDGESSCEEFMNRVALRDDITFA